MNYINFKPPIIPRTGLADTTLDGYQLFISLGDSKAQGTSDAAGSINAGIGKQWNRTTYTFETIATGGDVLYINANGSQWPSFINNYNTNTGNKVAFINEGYFGSTAYKTSAAGVISNTWDIDGGRYNTMVTRVNAGLANLGLRQVKGFIIDLGFNDAANGVSLANFTTAYTSLIDRLNKDFNNPPIYIVIQNTGGANNPDFSLVERNIEDTYSNVYSAVMSSTLFANGYVNGAIGLVHYNSVGNNVIGIMLADYVSSSETDKDTRRIQNGVNVTRYTTAQKTTIKTFISGQQSAGNWSLLASLQILGTSNAVNKLTDWVWPIAVSNTNGGSDISNNGYISTNGTSTYRETPILWSWNSFAPATTTDMIMGVGIKTQTTATGTAASLFGTISGARAYIRQTVSNTIGWSCVGSTEQSYSGATGFVSNSDYATYRASSSSQGLIINGTTVATSSQANSATNQTSYILIGKRGGSSEFNAAEYTYFFLAQNTGFNYSSFTSAISTLISNL